jgi:hypothetical protein
MGNNQHNFRRIIRKTVESLGFDEIPFALGFLKFQPYAPFQPTKLKDIEGQVENLTGNKLDDALSFCKGVLDEENERGDKIENKAANLIGITGISTAFITGVTSLISDKAIPLLFYMILFLYVLIVLSLTFTVLLAFRAIIVGEFKYSYLDISDVFSMSSKDLEKIKQERLASYLYCYGRNFQVYNVKASYLIGSQVWFRNTIVLFLILALILTLSVPHTTKDADISPSSNPTIVQTVTPVRLGASPFPTVIITSTIAPILTKTPTIELLTYTPLPTIQPSPTYTPITSHQATTASP